MLRLNFSMQHLLSFADTIREQGIIAQPLREARLSMIDLRDIAAAAVAVLAEKGHQDKACQLMRPGATSLSDAAAELSAALGRGVTCFSVSRDEARQATVGTGSPGWFAEAVLALAESYVQREGAVVADAVPRLTGRSPRSFAEFARDDAGMFLGTAPGADEEGRKAA